MTRGIWGAKETKLAPKGKEKEEASLHTLSFSCETLQLDKSHLPSFPGGKWRVVWNVPLVKKFTVTGILGTAKKHYSLTLCKCTDMRAWPRNPEYIDTAEVQDTNTDIACGRFTKGWNRTPRILHILCLTDHHNPHQSIPIPNLVTVSVSYGLWLNVGYVVNLWEIHDLPEVSREGKWLNNGNSISFTN